MAGNMLRAKRLMYTVDIPRHIFGLASVTDTNNQEFFVVRNIERSWGGGKRRKEISFKIGGLGDLLGCDFRRNLNL
jgi:hypothetical protein